MTIRVWALWGRRRDVGILLLIMAIADSAATIAANALFAQPGCQYECHACSRSPTLLMTLILDIAMGGLSSIIPGCFPAAVSTTSWDLIPVVVHQTRKYLFQSPFTK